MAAPQPIPFEGLDEHQRAALRAKRDMNIQLLKPVTDEQIFLTKTVRALETARQAGKDVLLQLAEAVKDDPDADVRQHTAGASAQLQALAAKAAAAAAVEDGEEIIGAGQLRQGGGAATGQAASARPGHFGTSAQNGGN